MFSIAICRPSGDKWQSKTLFVTIFDPRSSIELTFSIVTFPRCLCWILNPTISYSAGEALQPIQDIVKNYPGLALLGLFVAICLVVTCIWLKCKARKRRQGRRVGAQRQPKPTAPPPRAPQPRAPQPRAPQSSAPPPAPNSEPPATTPSKQQMYAGPSFDSGGVPPPAVYNPPPLPFPNQFQTPPSPYTQTHATPPLQHFQPPPANFGQASPTRVNVVTPYPRQQHMPPPGSVPLHPPPMRGNSSHKCYLMWFSNNQDYMGNEMTNAGFRASDKARLKPISSS